MHNHSPWIQQLARVRGIDALDSNISTDICVIGGGIAGVTTVYFLLTQTDKRVVLLEAGKIAHGATGHNAGQITSYFEVSFAELTKRYGLADASYAQKMIEENARVFLQNIITNAGLNTPRSEFIGYDGWVTLSQVIESLEDLRLKEEGGLFIRKLLVAREWQEASQIPKKYNHLFQSISHAEILALIESKDGKYIALTPYLSGCMNSAMFSEELVGYMLANFKDRFSLYEHTPVSKINILDSEVIVTTGIHQINASEVVLATNGFTNIELKRGNSIDIDTEFHHEVMGLIGYMGAYLEKMDRGPFASIYSHEPESEFAYFYTTRRPFETINENKDKQEKNLVCIGGPEFFLPNRAVYDPHSVCPGRVEEEIEILLRLHMSVNPKVLIFIGMDLWATQRVRSD